MEKDITSEGEIELKTRFKLLKIVDKEQTENLFSGKNRSYFSRKRENGGSYGHSSRDNDLI